MLGISSLRHYLVRVGLQIRCVSMSGLDLIRLGLEWMRSGMIELHQVYDQFVYASFNSFTHGINSCRRECSRLVSELICVGSIAFV